jgi:acyl carrier protein
MRNSQLATCGFRSAAHSSSSNEQGIVVNQPWLIRCCIDRHRRAINLAMSAGGARFEGDPMKSRSESAVHRALALYMGVSAEVIDDSQRLGRELGIDVFDLIFVGLRLEESHPHAGDFPVEELEICETVGDLVALFELWHTTAEDRSAVLAGPPRIARGLQVAWAPRRKYG